MRKQHQSVSDQLDEIDNRIDDWTASGADAAAAEHLATALDEVDRSLAEHLADEEREAFPVLDAVLSEAEWDEISAHAQRERPPLPLFLLLGLDDGGRAGGRARRVDGPGAAGADAGRLPAVRPSSLRARPAPAASHAAQERAGRAVRR